MSSMESSQPLLFRLACMPTRVFRLEVFVGLEVLSCLMLLLGFMVFVVAGFLLGLVAPPAIALNDSMRSVFRCLVMASMRFCLVTSSSTLTAENSLLTVTKQKMKFILNIIFKSFIDWDSFMGIKYFILGQNFLLFIY